MCGIVGAVAQRSVKKILLEGLKKLEYRGYDSAGIATLEESKLTAVKSLGKVAELEAQGNLAQLNGTTGIAHTRWATHGVPSEKNAHPHLSEHVAIVHNGIIENYLEIKSELLNAGYLFQSETDSEVLAHLFDYHVKQTGCPVEAIKTIIPLLDGAYGLAAIFKDHPETIVAARKGSPLVIGLGIDENFIASDVLALRQVTNRFIYLEEGDIVKVTRESIEIWDETFTRIERKVHELNDEQESIEKGQYRHFMLKEIFEQPIAIKNTFSDKLDSQLIHNNLLEIVQQLDAKGLNAVQIVACGTSYHAGLVAKYFFEKHLGVLCNVEIASEYRYRHVVTPENCLFITISQSGETADTLAALRKAKDMGYNKTIAICNVENSSLVRESDVYIATNAGREIGVASTKAFTTQIVALQSLLIALLQQRSEDPNGLLAELVKLPTLCEQVLELNKEIEILSEEFVEKHHALFLGRGEHYPIAMEGALKLKEISYIHAEAYAAGELKHGPLALVDNDMPVVAVAPNNALLEKLKSNLEEVRARGGMLYVFTDKNANFKEDDNVKIINLPHAHEFIAPIVYTLPLQLLSYHVAVLRGTDVDQPRNLAKSVTVE